MQLMVIKAGKKWLFYFYCNMLNSNMSSYKFLEKGKGI